MMHAIAIRGDPMYAALETVMFSSQRHSSLDNKDYLQPSTWLF